MYALVNEHSNVITNPSEQINLLHDGTDGWITLARKSDDSFKQYHYKLNNIHSNVQKWTNIDSYVSMNTFYTPKRLVTNLRELRTFYVDLDCYNVGLTPEQVVMSLEHEHFNITIPEPNLINYSGRGINLIWFLEPLSGLAIERWDKLQKAILGTLETLGSDSNSIDASRVFRLSGSVNSKNNAIVKTHVLHKYKYGYDEVVEEYFPSIKEKKIHKPKRRNVSSGSVRHLFNEYSLIKARMNDINTLIDLRNGNMTGYREVTLFLYRYWSIVDTGNYDDAITRVCEVNSSFNSSLDKQELIRDTASAQMYYEQDEGFRISNDTLIKWLNITADEQKQLSTIISRNEKNRRKREAITQQRRDEGVRPMNEYQEERKQRQRDKIDELRVLLEENPTMTKTAMSKVLGIGRTQLYTLLKKL